MKIINCLFILINKNVKKNKIIKAIYLNFFFKKTIKIASSSSMKYFKS